MASPRAQLKALRKHRVPAWWQDAKLGIFVHWTPASVPGFAPVDADIGEMLRSGRRDAMAWSPYTEWYENSLRFPDSPVAQHHRETYGDRPYREFAGDWEAALELWDPQAWARSFAAAGARYVVMVTKHHDGYCLWPTEVVNPRRGGWHCRRDVVGELAEAVRAEGMRFGVYYSGGLDWTFDDRPMGSLSDMLAAIPRGDYPVYAEAQVRELISRYRPSVLWNDIAWPAEAKLLWPLFADYYAAVPDGVVNDRWMPWSPLIAAARLAPLKYVIDAGSRRAAERDKGLIPPKPPFFDVRTPEYTVFPDVQRTPWECVRGMDHSFGYNASSRPEHFVSRSDLLWSLVDITAKGGNLLLNVGPRGVDAQIAGEQTRRLDWLADWMGSHESAVRATRPWVRPGVETGEGRPVRYTARDETVFAVIDGASGRTTFGDIVPTRTTAVESTDGTRRPWRGTPSGLQVDLPAAADDAGPVTVALHRVDARP
ncbi:MAG TPA: alpha-L-fucosidase [Acidimicrobiia bacterium]|nr:alpha-L-fucosidase [Acidimicrobiia bacterium]